MSAPTSSRVIVVGAGWTGLAAAKTYLQLFPYVSLTIIDSDSTVGGVWSASRIYPSLIADSCAAIFDYSDFSMAEVLGIDKWEDLPAEKVHEYLEAYVDKFDLRKRLRLDTSVSGIEKLAEGQWKLEVGDADERNGRREVLTCDKLIVATGTSSTPSFPHGIDWSSFEGPVMHSKEVGTKHELLTSNNIKRVTVVGGNKSAVDVVNLCALAGKEVDWVIRKEGYGPGVLFEARTHGYHAGAIKAMRASAIPMPNILATSGFWYRFLHSGKSWLGNRVFKFLMSKLDESAMSLYTRNENTMKIAPDMKQLFWNNAGLSVVHDNSTFFDLVAEGKLIHVHRASISGFSGKSMTLSDGEVLPCDAAVFATGWKANQTSMFSSPSLSDLGLQYDLLKQTADQAKHWSKLDKKSEEQLRASFPVLANPPPEVVEYDKARWKPATLTPLRLFRYIAPPNLTVKGDRSLIVLGCLINTAIPIYAEVSSLWGVAYLENLPFAPSTAAILRDINEMEESVSLVDGWGVLRFRDNAAPYLDGSAEIQGFTDLLVEDLGLRSDRKRFAAEQKGKKGLFGLRIWFKEWFYPYFGKDYRGLVEEYRTRWQLEKIVK
ncbi:FAD-dependent monooxygenase DEP4 [Hyphodiscus hymeniophilus]|uniref:FAD-dependent monooxygenase DEP4 n=1 Tax=Hyphodiscus hymeniophilus TaxID=353542 RepID=A0A9P6VNH0_9HELO|nr:FAD-dependent monooxygenase DEP4 [Hyphodiscus hymeniophilus]